VALFAERLPGRDAEDAEANRTLGRMGENVFSELQFDNTLDEAFASCGFGRFLSPFQGFATRDMP
jgi:hypothetical protein